ncbi:hypothetical protein SLA2020_287800 [Shorea laevis]
MGAGDWFRSLFCLKKVQNGRSKRVKQHGNGGNPEHIAAIRIQTAFRAYMGQFARRASRRLKALRKFNVLIQRHPTGDGVWKERWIRARPWEVRVPSQDSHPNSAKGKQGSKIAKTVKSPLSNGKVSVPKPKKVAPSDGVKPYGCPRNVFSQGFES